MASKRRAGRVARSKARRVFRSTRRKSKRSIRKLYAAKVGKSVFNRLTGRRGRRRGRR